MQDGNSIDLISDYDDYFDQLADVIDEAEQYVHVLFYIIGADDTAARSLMPWSVQQPVA